MIQILEKLDLRRQELEILRTYLDRGQSSLVYAMHGTGLSSFLELASKKIILPKALNIYFDFNEVTTYTIDSFVNLLWKKIGLTAPEYTKYTSIDAFFYATDTNIKQLNVFFDRFDKACKHMSPEFFDFLRFFARQENVRVSFVLASEELITDIRSEDELEQILTITREHTLYLKPLTSKECEKYIESKAQELSLKLGKAEIKKINEFSSGNLRIIYSVLNDWSKNNKPTMSENVEFYCRRLVEKFRFDPKNIKERNQFLQNIGFLDSEGNIINYAVNMYMKNNVAPIKKLSITNSDYIYSGDNRIDSQLSQYEFSIMKLLISNKGNVVSKDDLSDKVWSGSLNSGVSDEAIEQAIKRLREKLSGLGVENNIKTLRGRGYYLDVDA